MFLSGTCTISTPGAPVITDTGWSPGTPTTLDYPCLKVDQQGGETEAKSGDYLLPRGTIVFYLPATAVVTFESEVVHLGKAYEVVYVPLVDASDAMLKLGTNPSRGAA